MSLELQGIDVSYKANVAISANRAVVLSSEGVVALPGAAKGGPIAGITMEASTASGDILRVRKSGLALCKFGTTATIGQSVAAHDTAGLVGVPTAAWSSGDDVIGMVEQVVSASGDLAAVWLNLREALT